MRSVPIPSGFERLIIRYGSDFFLTQGLGGNCSVKNDRSMMVKASGKRMTAISEPDFFYEVLLTKSGFSDEIEGQEGKPSIEVYLHALLPFKYVVHLHSTKAIAVSMMLEVRPDIFSVLERSGIGVLPYLRPGQELMNGVRQMLDKKPVSSFVLANHGIVISGNSVNALTYELSRMNEVLESLLGDSSMEKTCFGKTSEKLDLDAIERIHWHAVHNWRITPDHVVFTGINAPESLLSELKQQTTYAELAGIREDQTEIHVHQEQLLSFFDLCTMLPMLKLTTLTEDEASFLVNWEAEKLRIALG